MHPRVSNPHDQQQQQQQHRHRGNGAPAPSTACRPARPPPLPSKARAPRIESATLRYRAAVMFYQPATRIRFVAITALCVIFAVVVAVPLTVDHQHSIFSEHKTEGAARAEALSAFIGREIRKMFGAMHLLRGFVKAGAPLQVPDFFNQNASERVRVAMQVGTAGAWSDRAFDRVLRIVEKAFNAFRNAAVQPGLVNVFARDGSPVDQQDFFDNDSQRRQFTYMVNNTVDLVVLPQPHPTDVNRSNFILRGLVFNEVNVMLGEHDGEDPITGRSLHWNYLWGGVMLVMNFKQLAQLPQVAEIAGSDYDWILENRPAFNGVDFYDYYAVASSVSPHAFEGVDTVDDCVGVPACTSICFRVIPRGGEWNGKKDMARSVAAAAISAVVVPIALAFAVLALVRTLVGPKPDPLKYAPTKTPMHAVCVDLPDANRLWSEVPFIMHDITTTFGTYLDALAAEHHVYVTMRLGCTAVAVTNSRERAAAFARGMEAWGLTFTWPPHIVVHCPRGSLNFAVILHTMENVTVRIDREQGQCDVTGDDMKALLLLRVAAVEQHVMCTGEFLGLPSLNADDNLFGSVTASNLTGPSGRVPSSGAGAANEAAESPRDILNRIGGPVGELGVCRLPIPSSTGTGSVTTLALRGYLVSSLATNGRTLDEVLDSFPDHVWAEWVSGRVYDDAGHPNLDQSPPDNPFAALPLPASTSTSDGAAGHSEALGRRGSASGGSGSRTEVLRIAASRQIVTSAHLNNGEADAFLPGVATDAVDTRRLALALLPIITAPTVDSNSFANNASLRAGGYASIPTMLTTHAMVLLEEHHRPFLSALSVSTYFLTAFRIVFAPLDPDVRQAIVARVCAAVGVSTEDYTFTLTLRCARLCLRYLAPSS